MLSGTLVSKVIGFVRSMLGTALRRIDFEINYQVFS